MKWKLEYNMTTGNSYNTYEKTETLDEILWENLELAKENLNRIKEHYKYRKECKRLNSYIYTKKEQKELQNKIKIPEWLNVKKKNDIDTINLKLDNGNEFQFWPPWYGYFETLHSVKIIIDDTDMKFKV